MIKDQILLEKAYANISETITSSTKREQTEFLKSMLDTVDWLSVFSKPEGKAAKIFINWLMDVVGWGEDADERLRGQNTTTAQKQLQIVNSLKSLMNQSDNNDL